MLPVSVRPLENSTEGSRGRGGQMNGEGSVNTEQIWSAQREQFLRHPSLRSNERGYHSENGDESKKKNGKNRDLNLPTLIVQDWSTSPPAAIAKPPPRPPRPPRPSSGQVPFVIITPCAATDSEGISSTMDDFPFNSAISSPLDAIAALTLLVKPSTTPPVLRDSNKKRLITFVDDSKPGSNPFLERDIVEGSNAGKRENPFAAPSHLSVYSPQPRLVLSESLTNISYEAKDYSGNFHSAVSETLADTSWNPVTPNDSLNTQTFPYTTSTPVKRRRLATMSDSELVFHADSLPSDGGTSLTTHGLRLPADQLDLLPYPDVFDLDMYFGPESNRSSLVPQDGPSPSIIRVPIEDRNPFLISNATVLGTDDTTSKVTKRFGFVSDAAVNPTAVSPSACPALPAMRETRRHRDQYRHRAYSRSPQVAIEDTSLDSISGVSITPPHLISPPRIGPSRPALRELTQNQVVPSSSQGPSSARRVQFSEQEQYPECSATPFPSPVSEKVKLPIVIVSHYRSPSSSTLSSTLSGGSLLSESV
ncbi:hypothetical protein M413DRAFT_32828 [Hebeloma cylindrosporum]|uniref:Uncharacterized protein n=1 Tax=Hebeloma cylindrosporum TaxID=76867 RepID=A0A0C3BSG0_HEBCY|nr:hypothetical protein M413DRAFT_32828 [Hebeloma cylindrosporum h7]